MSMNANRFCSNCGSPAEPGQRFCADCGSAIDGTTTNPKPTELTPASSAPDFAAISTQQEAGPTYISEPPVSVPPPPPPPDLFQPTPPANYHTPQTPYQVVPDFARPQKGTTRKTGLSLLLLVLVVLVVLGAIGSTIYYLRSRNSSTAGQGANAGTTNTTATSTPATTTAGTVTFAPALSFIYADVQVSVLDVKQAPSFSDDSRIYGSPNVLRLDIKEESQTIDGGYYNYDYGAFTLVNADGTTISVSTNQTGPSINAGVSRTNWLDFATHGTLDVGQLQLRVGTDAEAQMNIPLQNKADLSKYQSKSHQINKQATYDNLTWTITSVTVSYSALGSQAKKGMVYVVISSRLDNNSGNYAFDSVGDNMRLQSGSTSSAPEKNTLPSSVRPGQTGVTGNTTFEVPQGSTDFTCNVLKGTIDNSPATSIQFQLQ